MKQPTAKLSPPNQQLQQLTEEKRALTEINARMRAQLTSLPVVLDLPNAQRVLDARDDVEFYTRRLREAQSTLNRALAELGLKEVSIQIVAPK